MLTIAVVVLALALLAFAAVGLRIARNVGPLDLEDYARRNHVRFIPVSEKLVKVLEEDWSKPMRLRLDGHRHPLLAQLVTSGVDESPDPIEV